MTREEARKAAEVMMAYAEGKDIEFRQDDENWDICKGDSYNELDFNFRLCEYRIKKEPTYRPFKDKEECWTEMQKHQPFGWIKTGGSFLNIVKIYDTRALIGDTKGIIAWKYMFKDYQFADGTPFGIKEE